jgi:hypothetical protein
MAIDPHSATWAAVVKHAEAAIKQAHRELERPGVTAMATELERGKIAALRDVLRMNKEPKT